MNKDVVTLRQFILSSLQMECMHEDTVENANGKPQYSPA